MAVALADLSHRTGVPVPVFIKHILIVHECPLFRAGLRSILTQQDDCQLVGEATHLEDVLVLAREQRPDVVLLDSNLTSADPLKMVQQLRQIGVPSIMVFASPAGNEETLFRFLMHGATAYEDGFLSGEELIVKMHRMSLGECLITGDVLVAQAARRDRLARIRRDALLAARLTEVCQPSLLVGDCRQGENGKVSGTPSLLTEPERAVLEQFARGGTLAQVARALGISYHTAKNRLARIYQKLNVNDRTLAVVMALRERWIALERYPLIVPVDALFCICPSGLVHLLLDAHYPADGFTTNGKEHQSMQQHQRRKLIPRGFQVVLTALRIALLVAVVLAYGLAVHFLNVPTH